MPQVSLHATSSGSHAERPKDQLDIGTFSNQVKAFTHG
jgi:hypothetical protein